MRWKKVMLKGMKSEGESGEVEHGIARSYAVVAVSREGKLEKCSVWGAWRRRGDEAASVLGFGGMLGWRDSGRAVYIKIIPRWSIWDARGSDAIDTD